jgi:hypothetical protein
MTRETDLAYIAGLLDGEAYIGIKRVTTLRNGRVNPAYHPRIQVRMVDEPAIAFLAETLGGTYYKERAAHDNRRTLYCYAASDKLAIGVLESVLPYLRVKREVALAVLSLHDLRKQGDKVAVLTTMKNRWGVEQPFTRWRYSESHIAACESLWQRCSDINHGAE